MSRDWDIDPDMQYIFARIQEIKKRLFEKIEAGDEEFIEEVGNRLWVLAKTYIGKKRLAQLVWKKLRS